MSNRKNRWDKKLHEKMYLRIAKKILHKNFHPFTDDFLHSKKDDTNKTKRNKRGGNKKSGWRHNMHREDFCVDDDIKWDAYVYDYDVNDNESQVTN